MIKLSIAVAAAMLSAAGNAGAQTYPSRPITMLVDTRSAGRRTPSRASWRSG